MAPEPDRLTHAQRRRVAELALELARSALALNDRYPFPPDVHHRALELAAAQLLQAALPKKIVRPRRR